MFTFADNTRLFRQFGLGMLLCELNIFLAGMPPFQTGIWVQTEPAVFILFIVAALTGIWLALGLARRWLIPSPALHPLLVCLLVSAVWQILVGFAAPLPVRSWFGPPQTGDGTALFIATILTSLLAYPLWHSVSRRPLMIVVAISVFVQCALHVYYPEVEGNVYMPERWVPAQWPEYLPFIGGYMWVVAFTCGIVTTRKRYAVLALAMITLLVDAHNRSATGLFSVALVAITIIAFMPLSRPLRRFFYPNKAWRKFMLAACVVPFSLALVSPVLPMLNPDGDPTGLIRVLRKINAGIGSRLVMDQVGLAAMEHEPGRFFVGTGWGGYNDDLFKYALVDGIYTYKNGTRAPNWFLVEGSSHHSHNQPLEALLSMGLLGMALWYAVPMLALWTLPKRLFWTCGPMIAALTGLGHFWFQLPQCFPYQGFYLTALMAVCVRNTGPVLAFKRPWAGIACVITAVAMAGSAAGQYKAMIYGNTLHDAVTAESYKDYTEAWLAEDFAYGGDRWMASAKYYGSYTPSEAAEKGATDNMLGWYTYFIDTAHKAALTPQLGARVSSTELHMLYFLFGGFDSHLFDQLRHEATQSFEDAAMRMIAKAPLRDDYTSDFVLNLPDFTHNDVTRQIEILNRMLAIAPGHRGALWALGKIYLATPGKEEQGRALLKKAIETHAERAFPITDSQLQSASRTVLH